MTEGTLEEVSIHLHSGSSPEIKAGRAIWFSVVLLILMLFHLHQLADAISRSKQKSTHPALGDDRPFVKLPEVSSPCALSIPFDAAACAQIRQQGSIRESFT
jgi:hypothetical protein